jgi:hypothetical protein
MIQGEQKESAFFKIKTLTNDISVSSLFAMDEASQRMSTQKRDEISIYVK